MAISFRTRCNHRAEHLPQVLAVFGQDHLGRHARGGVVRYMVIETFKQGPAPVYARAVERGRLLPPGLDYVDSWVTNATSTAAFS
jgi:hypothetical protein